MTTEEHLALLTSRVEQLTAHIQILVKRSVVHEREWLTSSEFAKLAGYSVSKLKYLRRSGAFKDDHIKSIQREKRTDWLFHREHALNDLNGYNR